MFQVGVMAYMRVAVLAMVLILTACGSSSAPQAQSSSQPSATPTNATAEATSPTPSPNLAALCRIPLSWTDTSVPNSLGQEGFIDLTTGKVTDVPAAHLVISPTNPNLQESPGSPVLIGNAPRGSSYYDVPLGRWLPTLGEWISPDGAQYLYVDGAELHVVTVATGADRVLVGGKSLYPLAWTPDHIYVMDAFRGLPVQTYSLSLSSGVLTKLGAELGAPVPVFGTGAWVTDVSPTLPHANSPQYGAIANRISRIDLNSGKTVEWFSAAKATVALVGFTQSGTALIESTTSAGTVLVRLTTPDNVVETYALPQPASETGGSSLQVTDAHGTWLLDQKGEVFIYNEGAAPKLLATAPARDTLSLELDGGCAPR